ITLCVRITCSIFLVGRRLQALFLRMLLAYRFSSLKLLGYLPAFSLFGFLDGADASASSSSAVPTFCRASVACRTSDRLFNLFAAPERGLCFFPSPVGG